MQRIKTARITTIVNVGRPRRIRISRYVIILAVVILFAALAYLALVTLTVYLRTSGFPLD